MKYEILITVVLILMTGFEALHNWQEVREIFIPGGVLLNWRFVILLILVAGLVLF